MKYFKKTLKNGLRILTIEMKDCASASVMVMVKAGARVEKKGEEGLAHFIEHTIFKGTKKRPSSLVIGREIENMGASTNASTGYEKTDFYIKCAAKDVVKSIEILSDIVQNSIFAQEEIEKERGVIIEEVRMRKDLPMVRVGENFYEVVFGKNSSLGREVIGTVESVSSLPRESFLDFLDEYYIGGNILVVIAGGVDRREIEEVVKREFGDVEGGESVEITDTSEKVAGRLHFSSEKVEQTHLVLGGRALARGSEDRFILRVADAVLGTGFASRLFQRLREQMGVAYYAGSDLDAYRETGVYAVQAGVDNKRVEEAVEAIMDELSKLRKGKFSKKDLDRAKNYLVGKLLIGLETSDDVAAWHGLQELLLDEILSVEEVKKRIQKVEKEDIVRVLKKIYTDENLAMAVISPRKDLEKLRKLLAFDS